MPRSKAAISAAWTRTSRKCWRTFKSKLPRGTQLFRRGQVATMTSSFAGLSAGVGVAIVLVYFLIVVNFQSWIDPFIIITALPGALAGIIWILLLTHTTLSVPSLTGMIMCMGVATANSILVVSFARERLNEGLSRSQAAVQAGYVRIRPVLMTALAMIIGMVPLSLGLRRGRRAERSAGPRRDWRPDRRHVRDFVFRALRVFLGSSDAISPGQRVGAASMRSSSEVMNSGEQIRNVSELQSSRRTTSKLAEEPGGTGKGRARCCAGF